MTALEEMTPKVEQYSIDEMFLDLTGIDGCEDFEHFGRRLRAHVLATTGLTVGVGMGHTKTLAKSAQWASKEWKQFRGVLALTPGNPKRTATLLQNQPVEEIWGVGRRIAKKLNIMGIENALQLSRRTLLSFAKISAWCLSVPCANLMVNPASHWKSLRPPSSRLSVRDPSANALHQKWPCSRHSVSTQHAHQKSFGENGSSAGAWGYLFALPLTLKVRCFMATAPVKTSVFLLRIPAM